MSRSYKHTPISGNTTARSEKFNKTNLNRRLRRMPLYKAKNPKKVESNWCWAKDGKTWNDINWYIEHGHLDWYHKSMRK